MSLAGIDNIYWRSWYNKTKWTLFNKILDFYGRKCACKNCKESNVMLLTVDHINGGGAEHRRELGGSRTIRLYKDIIANNFPDEYQILCHNCNWGKGRYGQCPHIGNTLNIMLS